VEKEGEEVGQVAGPAQFGGGAKKYFTRLKRRVMFISFLLVQKLYK
jgi:hypothetical protein